MAKIASIHSSGNAAGTIIPCGNSTALPRTLLCNGAAVSRPIASGGTTDMYKALYEAIGTTYGIGDGSTTFNIPDTRGLFLRGAGTNPSNSANSVSVGDRQPDQYGSHGHNYGPVGGTNGVHDRQVVFSSSPTGGNGTSPLGYGVAFNGGGGSGHWMSIYNSGGTETRPANVGVNYCIAY